MDRDIGLIPTLGWLANKGGQLGQGAWRMAGDMGQRVQPILEKILSTKPSAIKEWIIPKTPPINVPLSKRVFGTQLQIPTWPIAPVLDAGNAYFDYAGEKDLGQSNKDALTHSLTNLALGLAVNRFDQYGIGTLGAGLAPEIVEGVDQFWNESPQTSPGAEFLADTIRLANPFNTTRYLIDKADPTLRSIWDHRDLNERNRDVQDIRIVEATLRDLGFSEEWLNANPNWNTRKRMYDAYTRFPSQ